MIEYKKELRLREEKPHGYICFIDKSHPLANAVGRVYMHRHVASLKAGRWLRSDEHVHHIDGDRKNNKPNNLAILSVSEHARIHKGTTESKKCPRCKETFRPAQKRIRFCSVKCSSIAGRKVVRPPMRIVIAMVEATSYEAVGRKLGVTGAAVKKWILSSMDRT